MKSKVYSIIALALCCLLGGTAQAAEMRRPLSVEQPMYIYHIDTWNNADPQKIIDLVPEDLLPYMVFNISLSVTESVTKDGFRTAESWLRTCAENRVWAMIQPASGGHSWFSDYDTEVYRYFFENYPNLIGFNYCEQFWGFDDGDGLHPFGSRSPSIADRMKHFCNLLDLCDEYGTYLVISNCLVIPEWDGTSPLTHIKRYTDFAKKAKEHSEHLIYCEKYTTNGNFYDMESMCLGLWLSGYSGHYGMRFDQCGFDGHAENFPESIGGMIMMEHMMMTGQTVTDGPELIWKQCVHNLGDKKMEDGYYTRQWEYYTQFPNVYLDIWRKFTTDGVLRIMPREEVIDSTRVAVWNDRPLSAGWSAIRSMGSLFTGLYALNDGTYGKDTVYLKKTGRYPSIPTLPVGDVDGFQLIMKQSEYARTWPRIATKQEYFNSVFAPQAEDDPAGGLYVRHIDNNWLLYNSSQYKEMEQVQTSTLSLLYNSCSKVKATFPMYSFGLITEKADGLDIYLNNFRSWDGAYTTDVIVISGCKSKPSFTVKERGDHKASEVSASYKDGEYTLRVSHRGPLDIAVKCTGDNTDRLPVPTFTKTYGAPKAPVYEGPRQIEMENADYYNIDRDWSGACRSDIPGFTALGYVSLGKDRSAKLRDTIMIEDAGIYKIAVRYLAPDGDVNKINISINGTMASRNTKFPKTGDSQWSTVEFEGKFNAGKNVILLSTTAAQTNRIYLDNMVFTPVTSSIGELKLNSDSDDDRYYNIMGIPVDPQRLQRGQIYIHKGKKTVIK